MHRTITVLKILICSLLSFFKKSVYHFLMAAEKVNVPSIACDAKHLLKFTPLAIKKLPAETGDNLPQPNSCIGFALVAQTATLI